MEHSLIDKEFLEQTYSITQQDQLRTDTAAKHGAFARRGTKKKAKQEALLYFPIF